MEFFFKNLVWDCFCQLSLILGLLSPALYAAWHFHRVRISHRRKAVAPFTSQPLRPPGESLRLRIIDLDEKASDQILLLFVFPLFIAAVISTNSRSFSPLFLAVLFLLICLYVIWRYRLLRDTVQDLWNHRLGFDGERVVGEELNQLMLDGYRVFHDLPFDTFNIDHVIVGASGVHVVETKTHRKPIDDKGDKVAWTVTFDGRQLLFPGGANTAWLDQASRNARHLGAWLSSATGEPIVALPILVIPGWRVDRRAVGAVKVLNEKEVRYSFPNVRALSPEQMQRIVHQLSDKCRLS